MTEINPLLAGFEKIPGISIALPTACKLYTTEVNQKAKDSGDVHVRPMSIRNEMSLKTPDLLINGEGIRSVINDCVDEVIDSENIFACDINTLLVAVRIATFGEMMDINVTNPFFDPEDAKSVKQITYAVDLKSCLQRSKTITSPDDLVVLIENGQKARIRPLTFADSIRLLKIEIESADVKLESDVARAEFLRRKVEQITDNALNMIVDVEMVDGVVVTDRAMIREWYEHIPSNLYKPFKDKLDFIESLGPDMTFEARDPQTKKTWISKIPINPTDFFGFGSVNGIPIS